MKRIGALLLLAGLLTGFQSPVERSAIRRFGQLPVLHNGRIKPMDSIARTSLLMIQGKQKVSGENRRLSPTEWLLELSALPGRTDGQSLFRIDDPDVRSMLGQRDKTKRYFSYGEMLPSFQKLEEQGSRARGIDTKHRTRFESAVLHLFERLELYYRLKNTLRAEGNAGFSADLKEMAEITQGQGIMAAHSAPGGGDGSVQKAMTFFPGYQSLAETAYYRPIPPNSVSKPDEWRTVGGSLVSSFMGGGVSPVIGDYADILQAYGEGDGALFSEKVDALSKRLESSFPAATRKARWEERFNRLAPFGKGMALYILALILSGILWLRPARNLRRAARGCLAAAFVFHSGGLLARMLLEGRPPVTNLYSSAVFVGWGAVLLSFVLERYHPRGIAVAVASAVGFASLIIAHHLSLGGDTMEMMQAVLDSNFWLATHVVTITIGYSSVFLASALAHVYLIGRALGKLKPTAAKSLSQMTYGVVCFALLFSFVGTVLGGIWADQSWGRFWGWDPKENGALLIVLWVAAQLHARWAGLIRELGMMVTTVFAGVVTSFAWFGVNMLGVGLHSYGFMDKAFFWLMTFIASQVLVMSLGLLNGAGSRPLK